VVVVVVVVVLAQNSKLLQMAQWRLFGHSNTPSGFIKKGKILNG
jgi:hypothetical protein